MSTVGFVEKVNRKSGTNKNGRPYTLYSLKLLSKEGDFLPGYYQCGFDAPACKEGDYIKLDAVKNDRGNFDVNVKSIKTSKNPPSKPSAPETQSQGGSAPKGGGGGFKSNPETQAAIHYQNSRTAAIAATSLLLEHGALKLVKADTKAGAASRFDIITESIDKMTVKYFNDLNEQPFRIMEKVADFGVTSAGGDGALPDSEDEDEFADDDGFEADDFAGDDDDDDFE
jgi:hypothetical protein